MVNSWFLFLSQISANFWNIARVTIIPFDWVTQRWEVCSSLKIWRRSLHGQRVINSLMMQMVIHPALDDTSPWKCFEQIQSRPQISLARRTFLGLSIPPTHNTRYHQENWSGPLVNHFPSFLNRTSGKTYFNMLMQWCPDKVFQLVHDAVVGSGNNPLNCASWNLCQNVVHIKLQSGYEIVVCPSTYILVVSIRGHRVPLENLMIVFPDRRTLHN